MQAQFTSTILLYWLSARLGR